MSEEDIRKFLSSGQSPTKALQRMAVRRTSRRAQEAGYDKFSATHLFCAKCRKAQAVREKLLLVLPDGDLYDYLCAECGTSVGRRKAGR